jgi:hypothetical protein
MIGLPKSWHFLGVFWSNDQKLNVGKLGKREDKYS